MNTLNSAGIRVIVMVRDRDQAVSLHVSRAQDASLKWHDKLSEASDDEA
jgi:hypothetical protein